MPIDVAASSADPAIAPASTIDEGVDRKRLRVLKQRFMTVNHARLQRARTSLDSRQLTFLDLLPLLFHTNHPMLPGYVSHQTPFGVSDYTPSKADLTRAQRVARSFNYTRQPHLRRRIHGLFLMGSCGTVAQTERSDFDIWVCHAAELDANEQRLLRLKCDDISRWATTLRLEVHFFLMEGEKFRLGEREDVSTEDCGSSQHYLLLDEFYRTGLLLAGRTPIWWLIPPDEEHQYDYYAETLRHKRFVKHTETVDFGGVAQIPAGEFIGAGIWQLTKAIDSPYKSAIKLLLTEVYASEYPRVEPLSSIFKRAIFNNQLDIDELDPYVMMYRKLERYLLARNEPQRLELVRRCFYFKVGKAITKGPTRRSKSWQRQLLEKMVAQWRWPHQHLLNMDARPQWKVGRVLDEQKELVRELNNSYRFLLEFARRSQATAIINGRDMTVLGRKLYAAFERKAGKVEWINPGIAPNLAEEVLTFCQLPGGRDQQLGWAVFAETPRALGNGRDLGVPPLRRAADLMALLAWCHVNGLLNWQTQLHVIEGEHGVTEFEMQNILRVMRTQLAVHAGEGSRHRHADEELAQAHFLSPNRPHTMQLFINVGIDPMAQIRSRGLERLSDHTDSLRYSGLRENLVLGVDQIVVNSWGEVTTRSYQGAFALLQCLRDYLVMLPPQQHPGLPTLKIDSFCPTRASAIAARVEQLFQDIAGCYYSGTRPASARYVLDMQREFYVLQLIDGQPSLQRAPTYNALLELLGRVQRVYSPIVLDRHCLPDSLLAIAVQTSRAERVQVFYQRNNDSADVLVLDEMGSVYAFATPFRDELTLLQPLEQFLQSIWWRQRSDNTFNKSGDGASDSSRTIENLSIAIDYYERIGERNHAHIERRVLDTTGNDAFFNVQAIVEYNQQGNPSFTIYCDQQEFSELEYGAQLFDTVARHILSRRSSHERYPCYLTDIDLSRSVSESGGIQTIHYLRYKQRLEKSLNEALGRIAD